MVATIGPASYNYEETLTTLRYANRAKNIKNKPKINEDPKDALLRQFQDEINRLKAIRDQKGGGGAKKSGKKGKKGRRQGNEDGEDYDQDDPEGESSILWRQNSSHSKLTEAFLLVYQADVDEYLKQQQQKLEEERNHILNDHSLIGEYPTVSINFQLELVLMAVYFGQTASEKEKLLEDMKEKESLLMRERVAQKELEEKIKNMEAKLLIGGKNIIDHTNAQERKLEAER